METDTTSGIEQARQFLQKEGKGVPNDPPEILKLIRERFEALQRQILQNNDCLELFKEAQRLQRDIVMAEALILESDRSGSCDQEGILQAATDLNELRWVKVKANDNFIDAAKKVESKYTTMCQILKTLGLFNHSDDHVVFIT